MTLGSPDPWIFKLMGANIGVLVLKMIGVRKNLGMVLKKNAALPRMSSAKGNENHAMHTICRATTSCITRTDCISHWPSAPPRALIHAWSCAWASGPPLCLGGKHGMVCGSECLFAAFAPDVLCVQGNAVSLNVPANDAREG